MKKSHNTEKNKKVRGLGRSTHHGSQDPDHTLYGLSSGSSDTRQVRLRSRRPFVPATRNLLDNLARIGICTSEWTNHKWKMEYCKNVSRLCAVVPGIGARPIGISLPQTAWVKLNHLQTGVGQFHSSMHKWGLAPSLNCECGTSEQTADYVLTVCPIHQASDSGSAAVWGSKRINPWLQSCLCLTCSGYPSNNNDEPPLYKF